MWNQPNCWRRMLGAYVCFQRIERTAHTRCFCVSWLLRAVRCVARRIRCVRLDIRRVHRIWWCCSHWSLVAYRVRTGLRLDWRPPRHLHPLPRRHLCARRRPRLPVLPTRVCRARRVASLHALHRRSCTITRSQFMFGVPARDIRQHYELCSMWRRNLRQRIRPERLLPVSNRLLLDSYRLCVAFHVRSVRCR